MYPEIILTPHANNTLYTEENKKFLLPLRSMYGLKVKNIKIKNIKKLKNTDDRFNYSLLSTKISTNISKRISLLICKSDDENYLPIYLDTIRFFIEIFLTKLSIVNEIDNNLDIYPKINKYKFLRSENNRTIAKRLGYLNQDFQWAVLRILMGAKDQIIIEDEKINFTKKIRSLLYQNYNHLKNFIIRNSDSILMGPNLKRLECLFDLNISLLKENNLLIHRFRYKRCKIERRKVRNIINDELCSNINSKYRLDNPILIYSEIVANLLSTSIIEDGKNNLNIYRRFIDKNNFTAYLSIGSYLKDYIHSNFMTAACKISGVPVMTVQHSGLIGYEKSMPKFYTTDMLMSDIYLSAGWKIYPREFPNNKIKTKIIPLPNPYLSELKKIGLNHNYIKKYKKILIPISKFVVLDEKIGSNSSHNNVEHLRELIIKFISRIENYFDKIIIVYRGDNFEFDPLNNIIKSNSNKFEFLSNTNIKPVDLFSKVDLVAWDVVSTGFIESLAYGIPTIAFSDQKRWSSTYYHLYEELVSNNILHEKVKSASDNTLLFAKDHTAWTLKQKKVNNFLDNFVYTDLEWAEKWREFLK